MGVRITKVIGYGVRDFTPNEAFHARRDEEPTILDFVKWCEEHMAEIEALRTEESQVRSWVLDATLDALKEPKFRSKGIYHSVEWDDEFGIPDVLVLIPPDAEHRWRRYNDDIDYAEDTRLHNQENRFIYLDRDINPYPQGFPPLIIGALAMYYGIPHVWPNLKECLYVNWG